MEIGKVANAAHHAPTRATLCTWNNRKRTTNALDGKTTSPPKSNVETPKTHRKLVHSLLVVTVRELVLQHEREPRVPADVLAAGVLPVVVVVIVLLVTPLAVFILRNPRSARRN